MDVELSAGECFRERLSSGRILPLIGVYDVFSARIAASRFEAVFCSGFSYAASAYGLPDIGFVNWRDITDYAGRLRCSLPETHILVDVDDGFGDQNIAVHTVRTLESSGLSAVMLEDQKRPRRCGHYGDKEILPIKEYAVKLQAVLEARKSIFVIARTDAVDPAEATERARYYASLGADGVMVEAVRDLSTISDLRSQIDCPIMVNQLLGGKSPNWSFEELEEAGASLVIFSTPCLFAAQHAIERYLDRMLETHTLVPEGSVTLAECSRVLGESLNTAALRVH